MTDDTAGIRIRIAQPGDTMPPYVDRRAADPIARVQEWEAELRAAIALGPCPGSPAARLGKRD